MYVGSKLVVPLAIDFQWPQRAQRNDSLFSLPPVTLSIQLMLFFHCHVCDTGKIIIKL